MDRKNILFITPFAPWPLVSGGHQAIFNGIDAIRNDHNVFIVYELYLADDERDNITPELQKALPNATLCPFINRYKKRNAVRTCLSHIKYNLTTFIRGKRNVLPDFGRGMLNHFNPNSEALFRHVENIVRTHHIDIVQIEMVWRMSLGFCLPGKVRKIFVHHELRYVCHELELSKRDYNPYEKACYEMAKAMEIALINKYDAVITLSDTDKNKLVKSGVTIPAYSSMAVVNTKPVADVHSTEYHTLTYVGPQFHMPNYKGVIWFLENCWEKLLEHDPYYRFVIIGKWKPETIKCIKDRYKNVEFAGFVDDINKSIANTISIVPLTIGSGIRMKILEAATVGIPIVTTSVGVEGIPFKNGSDCYIADDPDIFVESILKLKDEKKRKSFIYNAQKVVMENYSIDNLRKSRLAVYDSLFRIKQ